MTITRRLLCCAFLATATTIAASPDTARAQDTFPTRPMRLLVPYAAGGGTDAIARLAGLLQRGRIAVYLTYSFVTLLALLFLVR